MTAKTPYHEGERAAQLRAGESALADRLAGMVHHAIIPGARAFLAQQRCLAVASEAADGSVWASVLFGRPGLATTGGDGSALTIDLARVDGRDARASSPAIDPLFTHLSLGAPLGVLAIDLSTRRRMRINGSVTHVDGERVVVGVREAYPNCPKYIQRRDLVPFDAEEHGDAHVQRGTVLDAPQRSLLERADTIFVASRHRERGMDASHRGGAPGFVRMVGQRTVRIPDYAGNSMFNTLGNLLSDPDAGIAAVDFERRRVLQLTGRARVVFDAPEVADTGGTGRYWELEIARFIDAPLAAGFGWAAPEPSPFLPTSPATGRGAR
jgi:predicted pyridoxine 5'-phosphate oxidase superfamily flavin-nucleotide-binding protein